MEKISSMLFVFICLLVNALAQPVAFPGAEGFGKYTKGGRGGKVIQVTNTNDDGEGSLRQALQAKYPRIIVFTVSGTIHLQSKLTISSDVTIAGQSAPGGGICLADYPVEMKGNNIIVRYLRFRMGDKNQQAGMMNGSGSDDAFSGTRNKNVIIDHCSMSWSTDEAFSVYSGDSTTLQWNLIAEPLNYSYHFETGDSAYEHHGYGGIWGGRHTSGHHNLFAHCNSRTPRFDGERNIPEEFVDFTNNVIYNWGSNNVYAGEGGSYNIVNNYYKPGPSTGKKVRTRVLNPYKKMPSLPYGKFYLQGNHVNGSKQVSDNNWSGVVMEDGSDSDTVLSKVTVPFSASPVSIQSAELAYANVLKYAGATLPARDSFDQRIVQEVKNGTGTLVDVQGHYPHGTPYELTVHAWPVLKSLAPPRDTDRDGMPDAWEIRKGLNAKDAADAAGYKLDKGYTNVEVYLNSLVR